VVGLPLPFVTQGCSNQSDWRLEVGSLIWQKNQWSGPRPKVTFDMLFDKYSKQKDDTSDRPLKKDEITHTSREAILTS
jgi:hypothetical protein